MTKIVTIVAAAFTIAVLSVSVPTDAQAQYYRGYGYGGYGYNGYYGGYAYRPYYAPRYLRRVLLSRLTGLSLQLHVLLTRCSIAARRERCAASGAALIHSMLWITSAVGTMWRMAHAAGSRPTPAHLIVMAREE